VVGITQLRGRDGPLDTVLARLAQLRSGTGSVVVIEGGAGFGKTRLLMEAFAAASELGIRCGHGMADPLDRVVELAPLLEALFDGDPPLFDRDRLSDQHAAPEQRFWLLREMEALLQRAAMEEPVLLCLDDLHWADNGTAAALRSLPKRLAGVPIAWMLSTRPGQGSPQVAAVLADLVEDGATKIVLDVLSPDAVEQVVTDLLAAAPDADLLRVAERTRGNPFLLVELVRGLAEEHIVVIEAGRARLTDDRMPTRTGGDMRKRLGRLSADAERVAVAASSLGRRFLVADLAAMSELSVATLPPVVRELIEAGILAESGDRLAFEHDIIRDAVRTSVPAAIRREIDRRAADVLLGRGALPVEVATQLARSAEPGDDVAIATLAAAAEQLGTTDPAASADLVEHALRLSADDDPRRGPLVARRAISLFAAGLGAEAKQFADTSLRAALPSEQEAQVRLSIATMFVLPPDVRIENARAALALSGLSDDLRAWLEAVVLHNLVVGGYIDAATAAAPGIGAAVEGSSSREARYALDLALGGLAYQQHRFDDALAHLDASARRGTTEDVRARLAEYFRLWPLAALDRFDEATAVTDAGIASAQRDRQNWALRIFETWRGLQALQAGRLPDAAAALEGRFELRDAPQIGGIIDAAGVGALGRLKVHLGDERGARVVADICRVMLDATAPNLRRQAAWFLASYAMAQGDVVEAHRMVCALGDRERLNLLPLFPHDVAYDAELTRIALARSDDELVDVVVARTERRAEANPNVRSIQAAAAHVRGLVKHSASELAAAVELFAQVGRPLAQISALDDLGTQRLRDGSPDAAIDAFDQSLILALDIGAGWDAARARSRLRELGVRRRVVGLDTPRTGWTALTPAETVVVELVTEGRTNREIAEQLFVSPHTVSAHLRHVFEKLGLKSRVELTRVAAERNTDRTF
jgi:DNA-binding CsgD family transcriptional regulator